MYKKLVAILALSSALLITANCAKSTEDVVADNEPASGISESAVSEAGAHATASEGAASPMISELSEDFQNMDYVDPQSSGVHAYAACSFTTNRSTCASNVSTIAWAGCTLGSSATLSGGWTETWSAGFCVNGAMPGPLTTGANVNRVTTGSGEVLSTPLGATLTTSTTAHTAYDTTAISGSGITISNSAGTRTVLINGLHKVLVGPKGKTWFDHSIVSNPGLTLTGTRAAATRVISGTSTLYHNLAKYTAAHTFAAVTWGSATCCYPTSGSVSTSLTGSKTGNVTLAFTSTCGQATFTDIATAPATVTLTQCR